MKPPTGRAGQIAAMALALIMLLVLPSCAANPRPSNSSTDTSDAEPISVVASLSEWGSLVSQLGGDDVRVTSIVPASERYGTGFEATPKELSALSKASIVVANGAGYDDWATQSVSSHAQVVTAAEAVGASEGDNPYLWFSKDARKGMAAAISEALIKARPSHKAEFERRLTVWRNNETIFEKLMDDFAKEHPDTTYAATGPVAYYLMADLGLKDVTPKTYAAARQEGTEPETAAVDEFAKLIDSSGASVLVEDRLVEEVDGRSGPSARLSALASAKNMPTVSVAGRMPRTAASLIGWSRSVMDQVRNALEAAQEQDSDTNHGDTAQ